MDLGAGRPLCRAKRGKKFQAGDFSVSRLFYRGIPVIQKTRQHGKYTIRRMGLGYMARLMYAMEHVENLSPRDIVGTLNVFISPKLSFRRKYSATEVKELFSEVVKFNIPSKKGSQSEKGTELNALIAGVVHQLAWAYGWTIDYILSSVDLVQAMELIELIRSDRQTDGMIMACAYHTPGKLQHLFPSSRGAQSRSIWEVIEERQTCPKK